MRRRRIALLALVASAAVALLLLLARDEEPTLPSASGSLTVDAPDRLDAGDPLPVTLSGASRDLDTATVVLVTTAGTHAVDVGLTSGGGTVDLAPTMTTAAGAAEVWAIAGRDQSSTSVLLLSGPPVEPLVPFVGPKSIVADGEDHAMVVVLAADRFGNPVPQRTDIELWATRPDGSRTAGTVESTGLVAWQRLFAGTLAGRTSVATSLGSVQGPVADLDEVAGRPAEIILDDPAGEALLADGRRLHVVRTKQLRDRFGNVVTDGTVVDFRSDTPEGRRTASAPTIDGRAEVWIEAPSVPGAVQLVAQSSGVASLPLEIGYATAVEDVPLQLERSQDGWLIRVGPIALVDGGWIPDGTEITVDIPGRGTVTGTSLDGGASVPVGGAPPDGATVTVLGLRTSVR